MADSKKRARIAPLVVALGGAGAWLAARPTWVSAALSDDKTSAGEVALSGAQWAPELSAGALALAAAGLAGLALRRIGRRIAGLAAGALAAALALVPVTLLAGGPDPEKVQRIASAEPASSQEAAQATPWSEVLAAQAETWPALLTIAALAAAFVAAIALAVSPGGDARRSTKYERDAGRLAAARRRGASGEDEQRAVWDALDAGLDPTAGGAEDAAGDAAFGSGRESGSGKRDGLG